MSSLWKFKYVIFLILSVFFVLHITGIFYAECNRYAYAEALFSGLAFSFLVISVYMQNDDLRLTREELSLTRKEMIDQRQVFEESNKLMNRQANETTFFNMLNFSYEKKKGICFGTLSGELAIAGIYDNLIAGMLNDDERWDFIVPADVFLEKVKNKYKYGVNIGLEMVLCGYFESVLRAIDHAKEKLNDDDLLNLAFYPVKTMSMQELGLFSLHIILYNYKNANQYSFLIYKYEAYNNKLIGSIYDAFLSIVQEQNTINPSQP